MNFRPREIKKKSYSGKDSYSSKNFVFWELEYESVDQ